jgi:rhodanese-related sulfurtransferase
MIMGGCAGKAIEAPNQKAPTQIIKDISPKEAFNLIQENQGNPDFIIIDVRTPGEFSEGHIEKAINIDFRSETFRNDIDKLNKNKIYLIYCRSGNRSRGALSAMVELDFREVYHLSVGIVGWIEGGYPVTK